MKRRTAVIAFALLVLVLGACQPVSPEGAQAGTVPALSTMPGQDGGGLPPGPADPTAIMLPDHTECLWAGEGATLAFDGKRVNYTCGSPESVLLGDPVAVDEIHWTVTKGTLANTASGWELIESSDITFLLAQLDLVDGSLCLNSGEGATISLDGQRANWSCDSADDSEYVVTGALTPGGEDEPGAYIANKVLVGQNDAGFYAQTTFSVPITRIVGGDPPEIVPASTDASAVSTNETYTSTAGFSIQIPPSWVEHYSVTELSPEEAAEIAPTAQSVTEFNYMPDDPNDPPQPVLTIFVFTDEDWATASAEEGVQTGRKIAEGNGLVYVGTIPQSNPYSVGSPDSASFDAMVMDVLAAASTLVVTTP